MWRGVASFGEGAQFVTCSELDDSGMKRFRKSNKNSFVILLDRPECFIFRTTSDPWCPAACKHDFTIFVRYVKESV